MKLPAGAVIVTAMLILGGAAVINALSGMNIYAACFLIPLSSTPFTLHGPTRNGPHLQALAACRSSLSNLTYPSCLHANGR